MEEQGCLSIQKLIEREPEEILFIFSEFTANPRLVFSACLHPQGSQAMQKFLEKKNMPGIIDFFRYFAVPLANHPNGCQVIAKCFEIFPPPAEETKAILDTIIYDCLELAVDENGSKIIKILLSSDVRAIVGSIISDTYNLSRNKFGSSVIQHLIGLGKPYVLQRLVYELEGHFTSLSCEKYATGVVEKLIGADSAKYAPQIISEIMKDPWLLAVLADPGGFSLLKSAQKYAKGADVKTLNELIRQFSQRPKKI